MGEQQKGELRRGKKRNSLEKNASVCSKVAKCDLKMSVIQLPFIYHMNFSFVALLITHRMAFFTIII